KRTFELRSDKKTSNHTSKFVFQMFKCSSFILHEAKKATIFYSEPKSIFFPKERNLFLWKLKYSG
ncbi:MAG: hypothetical protein KAR17_20785, partial [Cyclobacteriaceae bacterium]|nr:hypothetical protein [Cyclobacteriaceae bacterium]